MERTWKSSKVRRCLSTQTRITPSPRQSKPIQQTEIPSIKVECKSTHRRARARRELRLGADWSGFFRLNLRRRGFGSELLPVAAFFQAGVDCADLCFLLDDERRAALGARFGEGHVRRREIAIGIARAAVEDAGTAATAFSGAAAADEFALHALGTLDAHGDRARVFALRIAGAADEFAEAAVFFDQAVAAERALFIEQLVRLVRYASALDQAPRGLAVRIALASQENTETAALDGHFLAAIVAILDFGFARVRGKLGREVLNEIAIGITRAAEEETVAADAFEQFAFPALFALLAGGDARFVGEHLIVGAIEIDDEFFPELFYGFAPGQLALFDFIEFFFEARGESDIENVFETFYQQDADAFAEHGGREAALVFGDVLALDDGGDDRGVGRWATDAFFLELLDQRGVVVARRRLGEMLIGTDFFQNKRL